jgi:hypothetical protein
MFYVWFHVPCPSKSQKYFFEDHRQKEVVGFFLLKKYPADHRLYFYQFLCTPHAPPPAPPIKNVTLYPGVIDGDGDEFEYDY